MNYLIPLALVASAWIFVFAQTSTVSPTAPENIPEQDVVHSQRPDSELPAAVETTHPGVSEPDEAVPQSEETVVEPP